MSVRSLYKVLCPCGHEGKIKLIESDQPYAAIWENYHLVDLNGRSYSCMSAESWAIVFDNMKPTCPKCDRLLTVENLIEN